MVFSFIPIDVQPIGNGLSAVYYDNLNFTGKAINRVDKVINFNWGLGSLDTSIDNDTYSARWTFFC